MPLNPELEERLLASIEADRLVLLCGAGLSMAKPSSLPSAKDVANACYDAHQLVIGPGRCDPTLRNNLEALANYFAERDILETFFISRLVPWSRFLRPPNPGHAAVADFLVCRAAAAALSANFDDLIERWARDHGADLTGSLDGDEATVQATHSPLLKIHGCGIRDRRHTMWVRSQLADSVIRSRIDKSRLWIAANLREKDLLVVGFWTDWAYLNDVLGQAFNDVSPASVIVIDLAMTDTLEEKAPNLWAIGHGEGVHFEHVQQSGDEFLDELRNAFSRSYLRRVFHAGQSVLEDEAGIPLSPRSFEPPALDTETLYALRRDAEGVPITAPALNKRPLAAEVLGLFHLLLQRAGAVLTGACYEYIGRSIRVLNGAGRLMSSVRKAFTEPPSIGGADIVVCVGATDYGLPDHVVRAGRPGNIVRPASESVWLDYSSARTFLEI